jgi:hypothetical protein
MTSVTAVTSQTSTIQPAAARPKPAVEAKTVSPPVTDSVSISSAGRAALQEATETPAQTAKEASGGDRQAARVLARQLAEQKTLEA